MTARSRTLIYTVIILGSILLITFTMPHNVYKPHGIALPLTPKLSPLKALPTKYVRLYHTPPVAQYRKLARVNVEMYFEPRTTTHAARQSIEYARQLTANAGGNALIINMIGHEHPREGERLGMNIERFIIRGIAVHLKQENNS